MWERCALPSAPEPGQLRVGKEERDLAEEFSSMSGCVTEFRPLTRVSLARFLGCLSRVGRPIRPGSAPPLRALERERQRGPMVMKLTSHLNGRPRRTSRSPGLSRRRRTEGAAREARAGGSGMPRLPGGDRVGLDGSRECGCGHRQQVCSGFISLSAFPPAHKSTAASGRRSRRPRTPTSSPPPCRSRLK